MGRHHRIRWARAEYDVDPETVDKIERLLRQGHKLELLEVSSIATKRFKQIQRHMLVFQKAMEAEDYKEANKALELISKIDGLMAIPVGTGLQELRILRRTATGLETIDTLPVRFVPMTGKPGR